MKFEDMKVGQWFRLQSPEGVEVGVKTADESFFSFTDLAAGHIHDVDNRDRFEPINVTAVRATAIIEINQPEAG